MGAKRYSMTKKDAKQEMTITRLKKKVKALEAKVEALTEEKDMAWFMLDEMKASDIRNMDLSERLDDVVQRQMANLKLMQNNKGEA
tara:strand:+ start:636 stop:893 length:258 start_codon:yes stop_codon:yes gene_type:complete